MHTKSSTEVSPSPLRWQVVEASREHDLRVGDTVVVDLAKPAAERVTVERSTNLHAGLVDRLAITGHLAPIGGSHLRHRNALILQLVLDQDARIRAAA